MAEADKAIEWYLARDGQQHGPISAVEMNKLIELGYLLPTDLVWRHGFPEWQPALTVFPPRPVAPPPRPAAPPPQQQAPQPAPLQNDPRSQPDRAAVARSEQRPRPAQGQEGLGPRIAEPRPQALRQPQATPQAAPHQPVSQQPAPGDRSQQRHAGGPMGGAPMAGAPTGYTGPIPHGAAPQPGRHMADPADAPLPDEEWDDEEPRRRWPWVAVILVLLSAVAIGGGYALYSSGKLDQWTKGTAGTAKTAPAAKKASSATNPTQRPLQDGYPSNEADVETVFQRLPLWKLVKSEFGDWYRDRVRDVVRMKGEAKPDKAIATHLAESLVALRRKHVSDALAANPERLKTIAAAFLDNLGRLSKHSTDACYGFISQGETNPLIVELTRASDYTEPLNAQALAIFTAIAEGRRTPNQHKAASREDYDQLAAQLAKRGWSPADLQLFSDARALSRATPERVCKMVQDWFAAQLAVTDEAVQLRLLIEALKPVVAG